MNIRSALTPHPKTSSQSTGSMPKAAGTGDKGFPIGTIHNGRQKVSSNPSKWIDLKSGHSYDDHNSADPHKLVDHKAIKHMYKETLSVVGNQVHKDDIPKINQMLEDWISKKVKAKNLQSASNVDSASTGKLSNPHVGNASKLFDEADKAKKDLLSLIKDSKRRKKASHG